MNFIEKVKFCLKSNLVAGEKLQHRHLGPVTFTDACAEMEKRDGKIDTLYIEHDGEIKEVTLKLIERDTPEGQVLRMTDAYPELTELIRIAEPLWKDNGPTIHWGFDKKVMRDTINARLLVQIKED